MTRRTQVGMMRMFAGPAGLLLGVIFGAACAGRGGDAVTTTSNAQPTGVTQPTPAIDPAQALAISGMHLIGDVTSGRASFGWEIDRDGFNIRGNGEYTVQSPGNMHLVVHYRGHGDAPRTFQEANDSDLLALGDQIYINSPALVDGWVLFTPKELGADWPVVQRLVSARSPINLQALGRGIAGTITALGIESIDGRKYAHYQGETDAGALMGALADAYGSQGQTMLANRFSGPIATDVWIDPVALLPRRLKANGTFSYLGASTRLSLTVDFADLNHVSGFPTAPERATPLRQLGQ